MIIETARKFPIDASDSAIAQFEDAFERLIFSENGYHDQWSEMMMSTGNLDAASDAEKIILSKVVVAIRNDRKKPEEQKEPAEHVIPGEYVDLAIELEIPPGRAASSFLIWSKWDRTRTLREIAAAPKSQSWIRISHTSVYKKTSRSTLEEFQDRGQSSGIVQTIINEKIDISRIRACSVCRHVFWSLTKRTETCGKVCSQKLGNQRRNQNGSL